MVIPRTRAVLAVLLGAVATLVVTATTAAAATPDPLEPIEGISTGQAILLFVIVPLTIDAVIVLLVLAPGWTRGGRGTTATGDPLVLDTAEPRTGGALAASVSEAAADGESGGTSAQW